MNKQETDNSMRGRVVVITGANSGIGFVTARVLVQKGATVIAAARTHEKAEAASQKLRAFTGNDRIVSVWSDFRRLREVRGLAGQILDRTEEVSIPINNAGHVRLVIEEVTRDNTSNVQRAVGYLPSDAGRSRGLPSSVPRDSVGGQYFD